MAAGDSGSFRRRKASDPPRLLPSPDAWEDDWADAAPDASGLHAAETRDLIAFSRAIQVAQTQRRQALGPLAPPLRMAPPPRPLRRTLAWQALLIAVAVAALLLSIHSASPPATAYASVFQANAITHKNQRIVDLVPIQTQIDPTIGYDSHLQYENYSSAACAAAATSSVLLAWGDPKGRIGQVIDDMIPNIQPIGMVNPRGGFTQVAARHGFNVVITDTITIAQLVQIVSGLGIPVVVGIRDSYGGYYQYFAPGHFLVLVGADANGFQVVDNSTYFVHYFSFSTFASLWDYPRATIYYPQSYTFQMPKG